MTPDSVDLASPFAHVAERLERESGFIALSEENLPVPPPVLAKSRLCATWGYHFYGDSPVEHVSFEADKATFRALGLLVLASVFHRLPEGVTLLLRGSARPCSRAIFPSSR
jgi:hypothetical protein